MALADLPPMLHTIIGGLVEAQPDMELVTATVGGDVRSWARETGTNVVIVGMENDELPLAYRDLLGMSAQIGVLGVMEGGDRAVVYRAEAVDEVSPEKLLAATRRAASQRLPQRS